MAVDILSATPNSDNTITVAIEGGINGPLEFYAGRKPDGSDRATILATGTGPYTISRAVGLWHLWISDNDGISPVFPVWLGVGLYTDEVGDALQQILIDHIPAIDVWVRGQFPQGTIKQVVVGTGMLVEEWPAIVVAPPSQSDEPVFMPFGWRLTFNAAVAVTIYHNDLPTQIKLCVRIADAIRWILSQPAYQRITLPSGLNLVNCSVTNVQGREEAGGDGYISAADFQWNGMAYIQIPS
jgi:hypothetical protein